MHVGNHATCSAPVITNLELLISSRPALYSLLMLRLACSAFVRHSRSLLGGTQPVRKQACCGVFGLGMKIMFGTQIEKAGGFSSCDGKCVSALDVPIEAHDQRTQICYGSLSEVCMDIPD